jgi:hypothetical protein
MVVGVQDDTKWVRAERRVVRQPVGEPGRETPTARTGGKSHHPDPGTLGKLNNEEAEQKGEASLKVHSSPIPFPTTTSNPEWTEAENVHEVETWEP